MKIVYILFLILLASCSGGGGSGGGGVTPNPAPTQTTINDTQSSAVVRNVAKSISLTSSVPSGSVAIEKQPTKGTLSGTVPNIIYTPLLNQTGSDQFIYRIVNAQNIFRFIVNVNITLSNTAPVAENFTVYVQRGQSLVFDLRGTDADSDALTYSIVDNVLTGRLFDLSTDGKGKTRGYDSPNAELTSYFYYQISDGFAQSNIGRVEIVVTRPNAAPVFTNQNSFTIIEDNALDFTLTATDANPGDVPVFSIKTQPLRGILSGTLPNIRYTPNLNYFGTDSFVVRASDAIGGVREQTVTVTITPVDDSPVASNMVINISSNEDIGFLLNVTDVDTPLNQLTYVIVSPLNFMGWLAQGILSMNGQEANYFPNLDASGSDTFSFKAIKIPLESNVATVTINIDGQAIVPTAYSQIRTDLSSTSPTNITLTGRYDSSIATFELLNQPLYGTLSGIAPNLVYTPNANLGEDKLDGFSFRIRQGTRVSDEALIQLNISYQENYLSYSSEGFFKFFDTLINPTLISISELSELSILQETITQIIPEDVDNNVPEQILENVSYNAVLDIREQDCSNQSEDFHLFSISRISGNDFSIINPSAWICIGGKYLQTTLGNFNLELHNVNDFAIMRQTDTTTDRETMFFGFKNSSMMLNKTIVEIDAINLALNKATLIDLADASHLESIANSDLIVSSTKASNNQASVFMKIYGENPAISVDAITGVESRIQIYSEIIESGGQILLKGKYYLNNNQMTEISNFYQTFDSNENLIPLPSKEGVTVGYVMSYDNKVIIKLNQFAYGESFLVDKTGEEGDPEDPVSGQEYVLTSFYAETPAIIIIE
jgi:hypothetical protein